MIDSNPVYESINWYVLNHIATTPARNSAQRTVDRFNDAEQLDLQLFAPSYVVREEKDGVVSMKRMHLTFHYVFLRGKLSDIKRLCRMENGFSFLLNRSGGARYAIIDDATMRSFQIIAKAYENELPYYSLEDIDLEAGDLVEVVNGDFPGLVGTFIPRLKSNTGNIVLRVDQNLGTVAYNIKVSDVRVLEFAHDSRRVYDQIDAFVPRLLKALRAHHDSQRLSASLISQLSVFCRRFEVVKLNNPKLEAKLYALLSVANSILGNMEESYRFRDLYERRRQSLTNPVTIALVTLLFAVNDHDHAMLRDGNTLIGGVTATSALQRSLTEEYNYYLSR